MMKKDYLRKLKKKFDPQSLQKVMSLEGETALFS